MKKKNYLTLDNEFLEYCKLNNIEEVEKFAKKVFDQGFTIIKHGEKPKLNQREEIINKWKDSGLLEDVKLMEETSPIIQLMTPNPIQKIEESPIKKQTDLYDE